MANPEKSAPEALREAVEDVLAQADSATPHNPFTVPRDFAIATGRLAALRAAHERPGAYGPHPEDSVDALQDDVRDLLLALGLSDHARPTSCHRVVRDEILPAIKRLAACGDAAGPRDLVLRARAWVSADCDDDIPQESSHEIVRDLAAVADQDDALQAAIARDLLAEHGEHGECLTLMVKRLVANQADPDSLPNTARELLQWVSDTVGLSAENEAIFATKLGSLVASECVSASQEVAKERDDLRAQLEVARSAETAHEAAREALAEAGVECETVAEGIRTLDLAVQAARSLLEKRKAEAAGGVGLLRRLRDELKYAGSIKDGLVSINRLIAEAEAQPAEEPKLGPHVHYTVEPGKRETPAEKVVTVYGGDGVRVVLGDEPKRGPQEGDDVLRAFLDAYSTPYQYPCPYTKALAVLVERALR